MIDAVFYFSPQKGKKKKYFKSLLNITIFFQLPDQRKYLIGGRNYNSSIEVLGSALGIGAEKMHLIVDLFVGDARRIFGFHSDTPTVDPWKLKSKEKMSKVRVNLIAGTLKMKATNVEKLASYWAYSQNMVNMATEKEVSFLEKEEGNADNGIQFLNKQVFGIDPTFFKILLKYHQVGTSEVLSKDLKDEMIEFISQKSLKELSEIKHKLEKKRLNGGKY